MKKFIFSVATSLIIMAMLLTGCSAIFHTTELGNIIDKTYDFSDFNAVQLSSAFQYHITQSDTYSIEVSTYQNMINYLDIHQTGDTLYVGTKFGFYDYGATNIIITMPELNKLDISGACHGGAVGFNSNSDFNAEISGASKLNLDVTSGKTNLNAAGASDITGNLTSADTEITLSGACQCELTGSAGDTSIDASGACSMNSPDFTMQSADVTLDGACSASIDTDGLLNIEVSGFSTLNYSGNPTLGKTDISGVSKLNHE